METAVAMMAKPFIEGIVKDVIIPKIKSFSKNVSDGIKMDCIPKAEHFQEYLFRSYKKYGIINTLVQNNYLVELKNIYIPLTLKTVNSVRGHGQVLVDGFPVAFLKDNRHVLITDTAGMGKSTMIKRMFLDVIDCRCGIPIYVELRRLTKEHGLVSEIVQQLNSLTKDIDIKLVLELFRTGEFVFFFDGYDEVPLAELTFVTREIQDFVYKAGEDNIYILTSRPDNALTSFGNFLTMHISSLTKKQSYELIRKLDNNGETSRMLVDKLRSPDYHTIEEFLKNPLLVSLLFAAFNYKPSIPIKKHIFYRQVFDAYFNSHDLSKGDGYTHEKLSNLAIDDFDTIMRYLGFDCQKKQKVEFEKDELLLMIKDTRIKIPRVEFRDSDLLADLLKAVPLFCKDGHFYKWTHKSLQEYFAAEFIYKDSKENQDLILSTLYHSSKIERYINLLDLYFDIDYPGFEKNILLPFLKEFLAYHASIPPKPDKISVKLFEERVGMLFLRKVYFWNHIDRDLNIENIFDNLPDSDTSLDTKCVHILDRGNYIVEESFARTCLVYLISNKMSSLVAKVETSSKGTSFTENLLKIEAYTNSDDSDAYEITNGYLAILDRGYYLKYDSVKKFIASKGKVDKEAMKNELLSGL